MKTVSPPAAQPSALQHALAKSRIRCLHKDCNKQFQSISARNKHSKRKHASLMTPAYKVVMAQPVLKLSKAARLEQAERREEDRMQRLDKWTRLGTELRARPMTHKEAWCRPGRPWKVRGDRGRKPKPKPIETSSDDSAFDEHT